MANWFTPKNLLIGALNVLALLVIGASFLGYFDKLGYQYAKQAAAAFAILCVVATIWVRKLPI